MTLAPPCMLPAATPVVSVQHNLVQRVVGAQQEMLVCIIDNRGVGSSSSPASKQAYSTRIMAQDALAVMVSNEQKAVFLAESSVHSRQCLGTMFAACAVCLLCIWYACCMCSIPPASFSAMAE
jgi:hypothetical protein